MELLCILAKKQGKFVSTEYLKKKINKDNGADGVQIEADLLDLNKKIGDDTIIYRNAENDVWMLKASITDGSAMPAQEAGRNSFHIIQKYSWLVILCGLVGIVLFLFFNPARSPNPDTLLDPLTVQNNAAADSASTADSTVKGRILPDSSAKMYQ